jgi:hypothetical protein
MIDNNAILRTVPSYNAEIVLSGLQCAEVIDALAYWRSATFLTMKRKADERGRNFGIAELLCEWIRRLSTSWRFVMDGIIYLVGLIVIVLFILSFLGLH